MNFGLAETDLNNLEFKIQNSKFKIQNPMLNLYQLQMFLTVAEAGSFSAAARELHLTQPAVSMSVAALEKALGDRLFRRRGLRVELTPFGHQLLGPARQLLGLAAQAEETLQARR